jgi:hypothetical protein
MTVNIGPVKAKLKLSDLPPPKSYSLAYEGSGSAAGHGKGLAQVRLESLGPAQTMLHYELQASVGGKLAHIGSRLVDMAAQTMAGDFLSAFNTALQGRYVQAALPPRRANHPRQEDALAILPQLLLGLVGAGFHGEDLRAHEGMTWTTNTVHASYS